MIKQQTAAKLRKMNMGAMVDAAESIDGRSAGMAKEDWLEILVDHLYEERMSNRVTNSIGAAHLPCPDACVEDLITDSERRLDLGLIDSLAACIYIARGSDVVIMGAAGAGKSWLASARGYPRAGGSSGSSA
jgi:DNA replication protein DnaC